ncbi:hypothetical protein QNH39_18715 [Neobacillus novalis]|uniref:Uncharacterized protein n=1 Tax=Neobacillus novalis TaxID=220687 RepID=A0AA95SEV0_9BACI|nr:hypothetical protein [Neobacillus novalis]WHY84671.1 hypothetical protein QNH39_18715 [Neobacillus novalis]
MANKFKIASNSFLTLSVFLIVIMLIKIYIDYQNYIKHPEWSAPFSTHLIATGIIYGVPVIVSLVIGLIFKIKASK